MGKLVNITDAKENERIEIKQAAMYIVCTMREVMKQEQDILDKIQAIVDCYEWENTELVKQGEFAIKQYFKYMNDNTADINAINDALYVLNDLIEVMDKYKLLVPIGPLSARDIKRMYGKIDDE